MRARLLYLIIALMCFIYSCGKSVERSQSNVEAPVANFNDIEQFFGVTLLLVEDSADNSLKIEQGGVEVSLEYTGGAPLQTTDLDFTSGTTLKEQLEPIIRIFEANISAIQDSGGSVTLIDGDYSNFQGYYSLLFGLAGEIQTEPYMKFVISDAESQLIIFTENACRQLEKAGVTIITNEDLYDIVLLMDYRCAVEYSDIDTPEQFFLHHSATILITPNSNVKAYKYDSSGEEIVWSSIYTAGTAEQGYDYEFLGNTPEINNIIQLKSRMPWGGDKLELFSEDGYLRYKGGKASLAYNGGVPTDTTGFNLDDEAVLKDDLKIIIEDFEDNIDIIKSNGGSVFLEHNEPLSLEGYYSIALGLLEKSAFDYIYKLSLEYSSNQLIIVTEATCRNLERKTLELISSSTTAGSIVLIDENCEYSLESYTTSPSRNLETIQYKANDLRYAYKYSLAGETVTIYDNLLE